MLKKYKDYYNGIHAGSFWFHGCIPISFLDIQISLLVSCFLNLICCLHVSWEGKGHADNMGCRLH